MSLRDQLSSYKAATRRHSTFSGYFRSSLARRSEISIVRPRIFLTKAPFNERDRIDIQRGGNNWSIQPRVQLRNWQRWKYRAGLLIRFSQLEPSHCPSVEGWICFLRLARWEKISAANSIALLFEMTSLSRPASIFRSTKYTPKYSWLTKFPLC